MSEEKFHKKSPATKHFAKISHFVPFYGLFMTVNHNNYMHADAPLCMHCSSDTPLHLHLAQTATTWAMARERW